MLLFAGRPLNRGLTLVEMLAVFAVVAILIAVALPSFQYWLDTQRVNQDLEKLAGALREAQREAMRRNQTCHVTIPTGSQPTISGNPAHCLPMGARQLEHTTLRRGSGMATVRFGFQGRASTSGTTVIALNRNPTLQRCLVIAPGLGIMRTGIYAPTDTTGYTSSNCRTS
ncbi:prepilin-type N-terminal cleavage/methylation domain-containing protein [Synechococcus sp. PCC 6717]|jgi:prepilin-type N-terminal cleavage/methylation domain-containing protein|uniref:General secretion pathway GspH domain-containing protein n=1 Tax=Parathermosynechococcus lividus PCC 6715 TaxID=1917166 RepID=A0A2D2Q5A4_PARLV|nr:GspH/FimT family pseudopilin [Thermostichus lividus]ATS19417.1 hypothetical protein BRW62_12535 [Thermostichus lividus PCC 6715]MCH9054795.1 prepilin-type N-terminal cleavage/methylation domain-containing protein [Synechococcus sp. PCC 6716]MCI3280629.1 prepilin-type N-terminal cleavage/methylation domain-containing protein [Synechococcus sp. PCC 6717]